MKATVSVTYTAELEIGDVPTAIVKAALEADDGSGDFNIFELPGVTISDVEVEV